MRLDLDYVRAQFPAFQEPALRDVAFFESAGGSYPCRHVIWRLHRFYRERKVQPHMGYPVSEAGGEEMDQARWRLAPMLGLDTDELSFGPSTTANVYVLANAVRQWIGAGRAPPAVVVTDQDHEANSGPWRRLAADGIEVREWRMDAGGHLDPDALADLLADGRVAVVAFPHASNVVGEVNDVAAIARIARRAGARSIVDGVSHAPHALPHVRRLGCDAYLFSSYKTYGPHQGLMGLRREFGDELPAQGHAFNAGKLHMRHTPAGPDHAQVAACAGLADYVDALYDHHVIAGRDGAGRAEVTGRMMRDHEARIAAPLLDWIADREELRLLGPAQMSRRVPTFALACADPARIAAHLARRGVMAGAGDFYAHRPLGALGVDPARGVLRVSLAHYNTADEVDRLIGALDEALGGTGGEHGAHRPVGHGAAHGAAPVAGARGHGAHVQPAAAHGRPETAR